MFFCFHRRETRSESTYSWEQVCSTSYENEVMRAENCVFSQCSRSKSPIFSARAFGARECLPDFIDGRCAQNQCICESMRLALPKKTRWRELKTECFYCSRSKTASFLRSRLRRSRMFTCSHRREARSKPSWEHSFSIPWENEAIRAENWVFSVFSMQNRQFSPLAPSALAKIHLLS